MKSYILAAALAAISVIPSCPAPPVIVMGVVELTADVVGGFVVAGICEANEGACQSNKARGLMRFERRAPVQSVEEVYPSDPQPGDDSDNDNDDDDDDNEEYDGDESMLERRAGEEEDAKNKKRKHHKGKHHKHKHSKIHLPPGVSRHALHECTASLKGVTIHVNHYKKNSIKLTHMPAPCMDLATLFTQKGHPIPCGSACMDYPHLSDADTKRLISTVKKIQAHKGHGKGKGKGN